MQVNVTYIRESPRNPPTDSYNLRESPHRPIRPPSRKDARNPRARMIDGTNTEREIKSAKKEPPIKREARGRLIAKTKNAKMAP